MQTDKLTCRHCGKSEMIVDNISAKKICIHCGRVAKQMFTCDAEWRFYGYLDDKSNNPTRCGLPIDELLPKSSLSLNIKFGGNKHVSLIRLQKWNIIHPEERSLFTVFKYMDNI